MKKIALVLVLLLGGVASWSMYAVLNNWDLIFKPNSSNIAAQTEKDSRQDRPKNTQTKTVASQSQKGIQISLQECESLDQLEDKKTVRCPFLVTSQKEDVKFQIYGGNYYPKFVRFIDAFGNEYLSNQIELGSNSNNSYIQKRLIRDIPLKGAVIFEQVPVNLKQIKAIELYGQLDSTYFDGRLQYQFRDLKVDG
ncbi:MAG: hypothetical protein QNJ54_37125 [Prochloraceae cyanobacterium]|nr:hypothetical protein [Prochloraceae cyanobacterium]